MAFDERQHLFTNNAISRLAGDVSAADTEITLEFGEGDRFPDPSPGEIFKVSLLNIALGQIEICHCTARDGDTLTLERAQEGTAARDFAAGTVVQHGITAGTLEWLQDMAGV